DRGRPVQGRLLSRRLGDRAVAGRWAAPRCVDLRAGRGAYPGPTGTSLDDVMLCAGGKHQGAPERAARPAWAPRRPIQRRGPPPSRALFCSPGTQRARRVVMSTNTLNVGPVTGGG